MLRRPNEGQPTVALVRRTANLQRVKRPERGSLPLRLTPSALAACVVWGGQFLMVVVFSLTGNYPHPAVGIELRFAMAVCGALLCLAMSSMLSSHSLFPGAPKLAFASVITVAASLSWSLFAYATVHLIRADPTHSLLRISAGRELALDAVTAGTLFVAWYGGWLALTYRNALARTPSNVPRQDHGDRESDIRNAGNTALWVPMRGGEKRLGLDTIEYFEGDHDYVRVHAQSGTHLIHQRLRDLHAELQPGPFLRVHRSFIVNVGQVVEVRRRSHGLLELTLLSGASVPVSRSNNRAVRKAIRERAPPSNF